MHSSGWSLDLATDGQGVMGEALEKEKLPQTCSSGVFILKQGVFSFLGWVLG